MSKITLIVGDVSSHGNVVTSGAARTKIGGIHVAHVGSSVTGDGNNHGPNEIATPGTNSKTKVGGIPVAAVGATTACGGVMGAPERKTKFA